MGFAWTAITQFVTEIDAAHSNQFKTHLDTLYTDLDLPAYDWLYLPVNAGDEIKHAEYQEMRVATDYADDMNFCRAHNTGHDGADDEVADASINGAYNVGVDSGYKIGVDAANYSGDQNSYNAGVDGAYNSVYYSGEKSGHDATYNAGVDSGYRSTVHSGQKTGVDAAYNSDEKSGHDATYYVTHYNSVDTAYEASNYHTHDITVNGIHKSADA